MQILILGMHRTGTSMVARLLNMLGIYFAPEGVSSGANQENPKGFWERRDVRNLNDMVLHSVDADWHRLSSFSLDRIPLQTITQFRKEAAKIILAMDAHRPWFLKEPRLCILAPLWLELLEFPICVLTHRSPLEVARSLEMRNGFSIPFGLALWEHYNLTALNASLGLRRVQVDHAAVMADPVKTVRQLSESLETLGVRGLRAPSDEEIVAFVDPTLYRAKGTKADGAGTLLTASQRRLKKAFEKGEAICATKHFHFSAPTQEVLAQHDRALDLQEKITALQAERVLRAEELEKVGRQCAALENKISERETVIKKREAEVLQLRERLLVADEKAANLEGKLAKQDRLLAHRNEQIAQEKKTVSNLRAAVDKGESALAHMKRLVAQQKGAIERRDLWRSDLQARLDRSEKVQRKLKEFLKKSGRETDRIVRSSRWKLGSLLTFRNAKLDGGDAKDRFVREFKEWEKALPPLARESSPPKETFSSEETTRGTSPKTAQPFLPLPVVTKRSPCLFSITIISSTTNIHGGTKRLLQVAQLLHERGHHVTFVTHFAGRSLDWFQLKAPHREVLFDENSSLHELEARLPDGDILLTYGNNRAASLLDRLSRRKGLKYLLFMHMGVHDRALDEANAFLPNFSKLATTRWIAGQLAEVGADPKVIGFGINSDQFFPLNRPREFRIGTLLHKDDWKRSADVVKAFKLVRQQIPQARLVAYGQVRDPNLGVECEYHLDPEQDKLREIYNSCAVWVTASLWEGIGMCSVEAMLCKTPLVTTDTGGSRDFCHDQNCILVEKESPRSIADGIIRLMTDPEAATRLTARAYADLQDMTWENCINRLEQVFLTRAQEENPTVVTKRRCELTIGVPIHNQPAYVKACLESIFANTTSDFELILVDDQSNEETQTLVRDAQRSHPNRVRYLRHEMRRGFPYNCNRIISNACGRYICFLNSDTVVAPRWDTLLIEALKRRPDLAATGPSTSYGVAKNRDRTAQQLEEVHSRRFEMNVAEINDFATALQKREADGIEETEYLNGFCLMIDSAVIPKIGFFNEKFGLGSREEVEFIDRMRMAGYGCGWVKAAYVHHYGNRSFDPYGEESKKLWDRNKQIYFETRNQQKRVLVTDKRIAFFYTAKFTSSTRKRTFEIARKLQRFLDVEMFYLPAVTAEIMRAFDIFILQRIGGLNEQIGPEILSQTMAWIEHYRQEGKLFFYDIDDFVFDAQGGTPRRLMQYCDGVIASTPHLLQLAQSLNPRCLCLKNGLDFDRFLAAPPAKLDPGKFHVICASLGASGQMALSQIAEIITRRDPDVQMHLFRDSNYCQALPNLRLHPKVDLDELFGYMKAADVVLNFDTPGEPYRQQLEQQYGIPLAKLGDFINAKSGLKYYNAGAAAKPLISTPQPSCYAELIRPGVNGFLAESIDDFVGLILKLRVDPKLRKKVGRRAFEDVLAHYTLDETLFDYLKAFCEMDSEFRITNVQPSDASPERAA